MVPALLVQTGKSVLMPTKKPTRNPTLRRVLQLFIRITEVTLTVGKTETVPLAHVTDLHRTDLSLCGEARIRPYSENLLNE